MDERKDDGRPAEGEKRRSIEGALAVAFGRAAPEPPASVLDALGAGAPRVLLPDPPSDSPAPIVLSPSPAGAVGRYQLLGEIARGGIGVVLRGRDPDLGRDVAVKVLQEEYAGDPHVVQRFVEEAQIGGQLQHPGIVPVYELGLRSDGRPYFTMKLVKGRTLAALLADRVDPSVDRRRFLGIFEQVAHAVGYAHARRVVHRDLKPSNVMIGAFGEVQVVDWGLAKVLRDGGVQDERRSLQAPPADRTVISPIRTAPSGKETAHGSVMGTPAYMSPEQAIGDVESIDERTDVFALGAILCEVLTGVPPRAGSMVDVALSAMRGDLADARARLAVCGADAEIVDLAMKCMAPSRAARPRDASAVAGAIAGYLASVEERARLAKVAVIEARARAAEESARAERERAAADLARAEARHEQAKAEQQRMARRRTTALSAAAIVALSLAGVAWLRSERERAQRDAEAARYSVETAREIDGVLTETAVLRGQAVGRADARMARQAIEVAKRAGEIARSRQADEAAQQRAAQALVDSEAGAAKAAEAATLVRRAKHEHAFLHFEAAVSTLRDALALAPECLNAHRRLAELLVVEGDMDGAVSEFEAAIRLAPDESELRRSYAKTLQANDWDLSEAAAQAKEAARLEPDDHAVQVELGFALLLDGDFEGAAAAAEAAEQFAKGLGAALRGRVDGFTALLEKVPDALQGEPSSSTMEPVGACHMKRRFAAEARLWERAEQWHDASFAKEPGFVPFEMRLGTDAGPGPRPQMRFGGYWAARAEIRAGLGEGSDASTIDDVERARLRRAALARARRVLDRLAREAPADRAGAKLASSAALEVRWLRACGAFRGVRDPVRLAALPADEQEAWRQLWADVETAIATAPLDALPSKEKR